MAIAPIDTLIRHLRRSALLQDGAARSDGELLTSFIEENDEAAFEALVRRHRRMVLSVCCRIVRSHHDAEDAFQATFLVLSRKAPSIKPREMVGNWLHGVAYRTALKAKSMAAKRRRREQQVTPMPEPETPWPDLGHDLQQLLDQELSRLPEIYRLPILLCDLEGKSIREATRQLGWPQGTLAGRLARGRQMLAKRLAKRGAALSVGSFSALFAQQAATAGIAGFGNVVYDRAAALVAAGNAVTESLVSSTVTALAKGVISMMLTKLIKVAVVGLLVFGAVAVIDRQVRPPNRTEAAAQPVNKPNESKQPSAKSDEKPKPNAGKIQRPAAEDDAAEVRQCSQRYNALIMKADKSGLDTILDSRYEGIQLVGSFRLNYKGGKSETIDYWVSIHSSEPFAKLENTIENIRVIEHTAIETGIYNAISKGMSEWRDMRYVRVWVKDGQRWQLVLEQD